MQVAHFTPEDLFRLQSAADLQISPDGRRVAYVRTAGNVMTDGFDRSIWMVDVDGRRQSRIATGSAPRWSPDGRRLAYVGRTADGRSQLVVRSLDTGEETAMQGSQEAAEYAWSPDGRSIAFIAFISERPESIGHPLTAPPGAKWAPRLTVIARPHYQADGGGFTPLGHMHLFVAAVGAAPRRMTSASSGDRSTPSWTPDGRYVLYTADRAPTGERSPVNADVYQVDVASGVETRLTTRRGSAWSPASSPDGTRIAFMGYEDRGHNYESYYLYVMNRDGSGIRTLGSDLDRDVSQFAWSRDGRSLIIGYDDRAVGTIARLGLDGSHAVLAQGLGGDEVFSVSDRGALAFPLAFSDRPAEVAVLPHGGAVRRLTQLNADLLGPKSLAEVKPLDVLSAFDARPIGAWTVLPPGYDRSRRYPTILAIHGGPYGAWGATWQPDFQLFAAAGYVVVYANPRGSTSYGADFAHQIDFDFPSHDYDDLMSVVDAAVAKGIADPARLFVTGGSAGGALTAWIVGRTDRFRAAVAEKPVINALSDELVSDQYIYAQGQFGRMPWETPMAFWSHSPLSLVGSVKTPTLLMVGDEDRRTPLGESEQFYDALQLRGISSALVIVPGASHEGLKARPSQRAEEASITLDWFARHDPARSSTAP